MRLEHTGPHFVDTMYYNMSGFVEGYYVFYISPMENLFWGDPLFPSIHFGGT